MKRERASWPRRVTDRAGVAGPDRAPSRVQRLQRGTSGLLTDLNGLGRLALRRAELDRGPETADARRGRLARWRGDFFGGMVAALIAVPYGMALSIAIGLRPEAGLYTSIIGGAVYGLLSHSPVVVSGLSATAVPILAPLVKAHGVGAALAASFLCGLFMTLLGVLRLGRFVNYLPQSVVSAFTSGLGVVIITSQLKTLLGVTPRPAGSGLGAAGDLWAVAQAASQSNTQTLLVAGIVIIVMALLPKWKSGIPASLAGVVLASVTAYLLGFHLPQVGALPDRLPQPSALGLDFSASSALIQPALTLAGLCAINQLLTVVVAERAGEAQGRQSFNRELVAQGAANLVSPFFGAPAGVAMLARSVASTRAGAVSRWSILSVSITGWFESLSSECRDLVKERWSEAEVKMRLN